MIKYRSTLTYLKNLIMRKTILGGIYLIASIFIYLPAFVMAQESAPLIEQPTENSDISTTSEESTGEVDSTVKNNDKVFTIYVHADCPHCQKVERYVASNELEKNVNYIELKNNEENYNQLVKIWEENNIPQADQGWPFMIVNEAPFQYATGDAPIIKVLQDSLDFEEKEGSSGSGSSTESNILFAFGGFILLSVLGYGMYALIGSGE